MHVDEHVSSGKTHGMTASVLLTNSPHPQVGIPACEAFLDGFNSTIFAYGQTSSGKTHTMYGDLSTLHSNERGLIPRSLEHIFHRLEALKERSCSFSCVCTMVEVYNEQIIDLIAPQMNGNGRESSGAPSLQLREDTCRGIFIEGVTSVCVSSVEETLALLHLGAQRRTVGETSANEHSSRSHSLLTISLTVEEARANKRETRVSRYHLVDLAGSERQKVSNSAGLRLKEANNINKSLSALGNVIMAIADGKQHIPYRDAKLTFLLRDSIGGNSKTFMVANVTPSLHSAGETTSTLKFASFAKRSQQLAKRNVTKRDASMEDLR